MGNCLFRTTSTISPIQNYVIEEDLDTKPSNVDKYRRELKLDLSLLHRQNSCHFTVH